MKFDANILRRIANIAKKIPDVDDYVLCKTRSNQRSTDPMGEILVCMLTFTLNWSNYNVILTAFCKNISQYGLFLQDKN